MLIWLEVSIMFKIIFFGVGWFRIKGEINYNEVSIFLSIFYNYIVV